MYPDPASTTPIETTAPPLMLATAVAWVPPVILGAPMVTSGTAVYPEPPAVTKTDLMPPDPVTIVAVATACTPLASLGAPITTFGADVYPEPGFDTAISPTDPIETTLAPFQLDNPLSGSAMISLSFFH